MWAERARGLATTTQLDALRRRLLDPVWPLASDEVERALLAGLERRVGTCLVPWAISPRRREAEQQLGDVYAYNVLCSLARFLNGEDFMPRRDEALIPPYVYVKRRHAPAVCQGCTRVFRVGKAGAMRCRWCLKHDPAPPFPFIDVSLAAGVQSVKPLEQPGDRGTYRRPGRRGGTG